MPRLPIALLLGFGLLAASSVRAHEPIVPNVCLDPDTVPQIVSTFSFTPAELLLYSVTHSQLEGQQDCPDKSCGIVDNWHMASMMAGGSCQVLNRKTSGEQVAFYVDSPQDYNAADHHIRYRFTDGNLVGACYVCVPKTIRPASVTE